MGAVPRLGEREGLPSGVHDGPRRSYSQNMWQVGLAWGYYGAWLLQSSVMCLALWFSFVRIGCFCLLVGFRFLF